MLETFPSVCTLATQGIMALEAEELVLSQQSSAQADVWYSQPSQHASHSRASRSPFRLSLLFNYQTECGRPSCKDKFSLTNYQLRSQKRVLQRHAEKCDRRCRR